jgi:predicted nucleic acid-binding protein
VIVKGRHARLADTLTAQACLDHDIPLITQDADFKRFAAVVGYACCPDLSPG